MLGIIEAVIWDAYSSKRVCEGSTVIDLGAGIGDFSVVASRAVGVDGKVVAVEPSPEDFRCLVRNLELNRCRNVVPINAAVSDGEKEMAFSFKGRSTVVRTKHLRDLLLDADIDSSTIRFVKIDIEGGERVVVPDNIDILRHCDCVAMELHDGAKLVVDPIMEGAGFTFKRISTRSYFWSTLSFSVSHPLQAMRVYRVAKQAEAFHGILKFARGVDVARSSNLILGTYSPRVRQSPSSA